MIKLICIVTILCGPCFKMTSADLSSKLYYYEMISPISIYTRSKRSIDETADTELLTKEFAFSAFNRSFVCHMRTRTEIFAPGFNITVVEKHGEHTIAHIQEGNFYSGKVDGEESSEVHGYFEGSVFTGTVTVAKEIFVIEPAWRHFSADERHGMLDGNMIVYRSSDMKLDFSHKHQSGEKSASFCGADHDGHVIPTDHVELSLHQIRDSLHRQKRQTPNANTCQLVIVADYKFYEGMGNSDIYTTASYMAGIIERVDAIYRRTVWNSAGLTGLGFQIQQMIINKFPTVPTGGSVHYNMAPTTPWTPAALLEAFSTETYFNSFCLAHLFTHQAFSGNVLGLAYIASKNTGAAGGICSANSNTGWSSSMNYEGQTVLTQQADLVTAHEFGHNWGSEHDPASGVCAPGSILGNGKYLMYSYSVSGYESNNDKFSSCSKFLINEVLQAKGLQGCFKEAVMATTCGNAVLEYDKNEECDAGYLGKFGLDPCCSSSCRLIGSSECSPVNHECCVNCKTAQIGLVCNQGSETSCKKPSYCLGDGFDCPTPQNADDNTTCLDSGKCFQGVCRPFCEARNKISCVCDEVATSCLRCCRSNTSAACEPYSTTPLPNGRPCVQGYCDSGSCKKTTQSTIERLFSIIQTLSIDKILEFFRNNIVGAVMIFSLIVWIPVCIFLSLRDYERKKRFKLDMYREIRRDRFLVFDEDGRKTKTSEKEQQLRQRPQSSASSNHLYDVSKY
ncbi:ADAM 17-like protease [Gigantopelta aegis]|uniref:ADAM 17-like protease n=1 Tax=Gigantopelta aegis TaxID=1735272 RepID=UPI001B888583|nr:ADAM 17-like protease [Gigantopelta aegis]